MGGKAQAVTSESLHIETSTSRAADVRSSSSCQLHTQKWSSASVVTGSSRTIHVPCNGCHVASPTVSEKASIASIAPVTGAGRNAASWHGAAGGLAAYGSAGRVCPLCVHAQPLPQPQQQGSKAAASPLAVNFWQSPYGQRQKTLGPQQLAR